MESKIDSDIELDCESIKYDSENLEQSEYLVRID